MGIKVVKRDGILVDFDSNKIVEAISKACREVGEEEEILKQISRHISREIEKIAEQKRKTIKIEEIQDLVVKMLKDTGFNKASKAYQEYREKRTAVRELNGDIVKGAMGVINGSNKEVLTENANKGSINASVTQHRDLIAGVVSRKIAESIIPEDIVDAHRRAEIHIHDTDYFMSPVTNCCLINLEDMLMNGTVVNGVTIDRPKSLRTAATICSQIIAQVASSQYGGCTVSIGHLAPFVRISKKKIENKYKDFPLTEECFNLVVDKELRSEIKDAVQIIQYQINTFMLITGQQPFVSLGLNLNCNPEYMEETAMLIEEVLIQRIKGIKNQHGVYSTPVFPKLLYFTLDNLNIKQGDKYFYLTELASKCISKRMNPDIISGKKMVELIGYVFECMGCRSFLSPWFDENGKLKIYGRLNVGVQTVNLPYVALKSIRDNRNFFEVLDETLELIHRMGNLRFDKLKGVKAKVAPILWQYGAFMRLDAEEEILPHLENGYATVSLGYSGVDQTVRLLCGEDITKPIGHELGKEIIKHLKDKCDIWKKESGRAWSPYGCPQESTTDKFVKGIKREFGEVKGVTDEGYITNSYHVDPATEINAFDKLTCESDLSQYSLGGQVSYVETGNLEKNIEAIIELIQHMHETNIYAEVNNTTSDYCCVCGDSTTCDLDENLEWYCTKCGNKDINKLSVCRRVCGYLSNNVLYGAKEARLKDIKSRVTHL